MQIRTYNARDMRQALRMIRENQGEDAVILSTRQLGDGVEVCAATDMPDATEPSPAIAAVASPPVAIPAVAVASRATAAAADSSEPVPEAGAHAAAEMGAELRSMRHLLEWQLSQLAWNDLARRTPTQAQLLKELTEIGLAAPLATSLVEELPDGLGIEEAQRRMLAQLARRIPVTGDSLLDHGGRVAFVGPTGVGKTTLIAKLAARWVMRHGARDIALISMDDQRFGAHEQLRVLGRLLGVECFSLESVAQLPGILARLSRHRLVLIDTAGVSPRDPQLGERATALRDVAAQVGLEIWLALSAGAQAGVLEEAMQRFAAFAPRGALFTKLDEATSLGGAISALIAAGIPLSYLSEGPRIPEDLAPARSHQVVSRAVALARVNDATAPEDLLVRRFGSCANERR